MAGIGHSYQNKKKEQTNMQTCRRADNKRTAQPHNKDIHFSQMATKTSRKKEKKKTETLAAYFFIKYRGMCDHE